MVNFGLVSKIIGQLLCLESFLMLWCVIMSYAYGEDDSIAFLIATILTLCGGMLFLYFGRHAGNLGESDEDLMLTAERDHIIRVRRLVVAEIKRTDQHGQTPQQAEQNSPLSVLSDCSLVVLLHKVKGLRIIFVH